MIRIFAAYAMGAAIATLTYKAWTVGNSMTLFLTGMLIASSVWLAMLLGQWINEDIHHQEWDD